MSKLEGRPYLKPSNKQRHPGKVQGLAADLEQLHVSRLLTSWFIHQLSRLHPLYGELTTVLIFSSFIWTGKTLQAFLGNILKMDWETCKCSKYYKLLSTQTGSCDTFDFWQRYIGFFDFSRQRGGCSSTEQNQLLKGLPAQKRGGLSSRIGLVSPALPLYGLDLHKQLRTDGEVSLESYTCVTCEVCFCSIYGSLVGF